MKKYLLLSTFLTLLTVFPSAGQRAASIKINEVMTFNTGDLQDDYGRRKSWIEIANVSYSTYNLEGMFLTSDRRVLDKTMSAPERMALMCPIPGGDKITRLTARQHIVFFANSRPQDGTLYLALDITPGAPTWLALYDGNGVDLIDSVTVPFMPYANQSWARAADGASRWELRRETEVTPGISNTASPAETKAAKIKREDPHGIGLSILSMGIVFVCLALLFIFFWALGLLMSNSSKKTARKIAEAQPMKTVVRQAEKVAETGHKTNVMLKEGIHTKGIDKEIYIAVIAMALKQYQDEVHDVESGVITIKPKESHWSNF